MAVRYAQSYCDTYLSSSENILDFVHFTVSQSYAKTYRGLLFNAINIQEDVLINANSNA